MKDQIYLNYVTCLTLIFPRVPPMLVDCDWRKMLIRLLYGGGKYILVTLENGLQLFRDG